MIFKNTDFSEKIKAPSSKSECIRALICSAMADKPTDVISSTCTDTDVCAEAIRSLGAKAEKTNCGYKVTPWVYEPENDDYIPDFKDCATALRLIYPLAMRLDDKFRFKASVRLLERVAGTLPTNEDINADSIDIKADTSSQTVSGMIVKNVFSGGIINLDGEVVSRQYIELTANVFRKFGAEIKTQEHKIVCRGGKLLMSPGEYIVNGDFSGSAFLMVAGLIGSHPIEICGLDFENPTSIDREICNHLMRMGGNVEILPDRIICSPSELRAIDVLCENIPDLVPPLCCAAAFAKGTTVLKNVSRLKFKESDRIEELLQLLDNAGIKSEYKDGNLYINGTDSYIKFKSKTITTDHRIAMAALVLSIHSENGAEIDNSTCIDKSFPGFISLIK